VERTGAPPTVEKEPVAAAPWQPPMVPEIDLQPNPLAQIVPNNSLAASTTAQDEVSAELDALFTQLNNPKPRKSLPKPKPAAVEPPVETSTDSPTPVRTPTRVNATGEKPSAADDEELLAYVNGTDNATPLDASAADIAAEAIAAVTLNTTAGETQTGNALTGTAEGATPTAALPLFLRPLEWINAPFAAIPDAARAALGKVAIATLINAVAVLAYVILFRAKH
jgi:hypothetical protein